VRDAPQGRTQRLRRNNLPSPRYGRGEKINTLSREFDALLARMQTPTETASEHQLSSYGRRSRRIAKASLMRCFAVVREAAEL